MALPAEEIQMQCALLEDDAALGSHIVRALAALGHQISHFRDARSMIRELRRESFDLLLLDWSLPVSSGIEVLRWTQEHLDPAPPAIMITARTAEADVVAGLTSGAADYIVKPFQDDVLRARVEALLRRVYGSRAKRSVECFGDYIFDIDEQAVTMAGVPVLTTTKEFALALLLFRNLHRPLSRNYILETLWAHAPNAQSRTLDSHIAQIRRRLELRPENGLRLSSVYGFGYRLERFELKASTPPVRQEFTQDHVGY